MNRGTEKIPIDTLRVDAFSGGMNTSGSPRDIASNECSLIENLEFDDLDNLVTRNGISFAHNSIGGLTGSIFSFNAESGFVGILNSVGTNLFSSTIDGVQTNITGALVLPNNVRWYWKSLNNVAVGVNGSTGAGNPIQVVGPAPGTASHLAAAPDGKLIEEWGKRLWIVHVANPNRIQCSNLGTAITWGTSGLTNPIEGIIIDITPGDGDVITALFAFKERLFIFKRKRIYVIRITAIPETDPSNWEVAEYSKILGCINQSTVREVFDDVVFLSEGGLASLAAAELAADFSSTIISNKISEIQRIRKDASEFSICAFVFADRSQYWLFVDATASPTGRQILWVMDYKQIRKGPRWTIFTFSGSSFQTPLTAIEQHSVGQNQVVYLLAITTGLSGTSSTVLIYKPNVPVNQREFTDRLGTTSINFRPIIQKLETKAFDFDLDNIRKLFQEWYLRFSVISNKAHFKISYEMDDPLSPVVNYIFDAYGLNFNIENIIRQSFKHDVQRKSISCRFIMTIGEDLDQGVSIKNFGIQYAVLSERRSESMLITTTLKNVSQTINRNIITLGNIGVGQDLIYNFLLPFDSLKTDRDFVDINSSGSLANNDNNKEIILQVGGNEITGVGGQQVAGISGAFDFDGAADRNSWYMKSRIMRIDATHIAVMSLTSVGQFLADGAGTFSNTNGLSKADTKTLTVGDLGLNDLTIQVLAQGIADNDITHRQTIVELNQQ